MKIARDRYIEKLEARRHNGSVKVITGVRRCGKSYLLSKLYRDHLLEDGVDPGQIVSVDFDRRSNRHLRDPDVLLSYVTGRISDGWCYVFLDEIQMVKDFTEVVNEINSYDNTDVYVTGSNSRFLSKDVLTEFRGRGDEIHVLPLSFSEYLSAVKGDKRDAFRDYCMYGGMPASVSKKGHEEKTAYLSNLFKEVYIKDIMERSGITDEDLLSRIIDALLSSVGSLTNPRRTADYLTGSGYRSVSDTTVSSYMGLIEDSFLVEKALRFDVKGKEYLSTPYKYYAADVGLRNARLNYRQTELTHLTENIIYNELRLRGFDVDVGVVPIRDPDSGYVQTEIDFIATKGYSKYYIQSAYSLEGEGKRDQEIRPFRRLDDSFRRLIVTSDDVNMWVDDSGVITVNIIDFLIDWHILEKLP